MPTRFIHLSQRTWLLLCLTLCTIIVPIQAMPIYQEDPYSKENGYNCCDMLENGELLILQQFLKPLDIVFDVGAHVGDWSIQALNCCPNIYIHAFEPNPLACTAFINQLQGSPVNLYPFALSNEMGTRSLVSYVNALGNDPLNGSMLNSFFHRTVIEQLQTAQYNHSIIQIYTASLDDFCIINKINHIDFLKIDTEGAELLILKGARQLLSNNKIKNIQFEYGGTYPDAGITLKEVYDLLTFYNYALFRILPHGLLCIPHWDSSLENYQYSNYFATKIIEYK